MGKRENDGSQNQNGRTSGTASKPDKRFKNKPRNRAKTQNRKNENIIRRNYTNVVTSRKYLKEHTRRIRYDTKPQIQTRQTNKATRIPKHNIKHYSYKKRNTNQWRDFNRRKIKIATDKHLLKNKKHIATWQEEESS